MKTDSYRSSGSRVLMTGTVLLVAAGTLVSTAFNPFAANKRARLAEHLNNVRQVKFALDGFATDFDGQFPNFDTGEKVVVGGLGGKTSNDYFRQLFMAGEIVSEQIFWVKNASVCTKKKPDDITTKRGRPVKEEILKPGDCGWAYMKDQTNTSLVGRPLIVDAYKAGTKEFDRKLWDDKVIVLRIDGAAKPMALDAQGKLMENGEDILSAKAKRWMDGKKDPLKLLVQPDPAPEDAK